MAFPLHLRCFAVGLLAGGACLAGVPAATATEPLPACASLTIPDKPSQRTWCTTPHATLVIAHQSDPVLVDGTQVRVLDGHLLGTTVSVRLRVRNDTPAEQGLGAGGQELYLYLGGAHVYAAVSRVVRFATGEAKTVTLDFELTPEQVAALEASDGQVDFGVRPWTDAVTPVPLIGVVRMHVAH